MCHLGSSRDISSMMSATEAVYEEIVDVEPAIFGFDSW